MAMFHCGMKRDYTNAANSMCGIDKRLGVTLFMCLSCPPLSLQLAVVPFTAVIIVVTLYVLGMKQPHHL